MNYVFEDILDGDIIIDSENITSYYQALKNQCGTIDLVVSYISQIEDPQNQAQFIEAFVNHESQIEVGDITTPKPNRECILSQDGFFLSYAEGFPKHFATLLNSMAVSKRNLSQVELTHFLHRLGHCHVKTVTRQTENGPTQLIACYGYFDLVRSEQIAWSDFERKIADPVGRRLFNKLMSEYHLQNNHQKFIPIPKAKM